MAGSLRSKMFDVGDLPLLTFGNCALKTAVIKWHLKLYVGFLRFFFKIKKKHDYVLSEFVHTFPRTLATPLSRRKEAPPNGSGHTSWLLPPGAGNRSDVTSQLSHLSGCQGDGVVYVIGQPGLRVVRRARINDGRSADR